LLALLLNSAIETFCLWARERKTWPAECGASLLNSEERAFDRVDLPVS